MTIDIASTYHVIDVDTHVIEPPDLWTSRVSSKWGALVPHVRADRRGKQRWFLGDEALPAVAAVAHAGWKEYPPGHPPSLEEADRGSWDPHARLERMDEYGLYAQVLYPNLLGFQCESIMRMNDHELGLACVRAYNDFLVDFCSVDTGRLVPIAWIPFWDRDASVREMERCAKMGHRGIVFGSDFTAVGLPAGSDVHWDPIYAAAQDLNFSVNFHIGFADSVEENKAVQRSVASNKAAFVKESTLMFMSNAQTMADFIVMGVCHRFPRLNFVSVESGASWLPFLVEALDWQWQASGAFKTFPDRLLPSEYFRRQVYGSFWFESSMLQRAIELFPDNLMFETDYPHPTSLSPGPASIARNPRVVLNEGLRGLPDAIIQKAVHGNAARVYGIEIPALRDSTAVHA